MADISLRIKADFERAEKEFRELENVSESTRKKIEKFSQSFKTEQIDKFIERNRLNATAIGATQGKVAGMQAEYKGLQREIQNLIRKGMSPQDEALQRLIKDYDRLDKELASTNIAVKRTSVSFMSMVKAIIGAGLIERAIRGIGRAFRFIFDEARKLEDAEAAFTPLMGGVDKARELVRRLNVEAATTPFQFENIQKSVSTLLPVMNGDIQKTITTFRMLGDTAGGNAQKLESITRGYTKALLKGRVDMESLNMIAEAGVPIFNELAATMGYGENQMQQFFKRISTGTVSTDELTKAFQKMTSEGGKFFQGMIISSKTTSGVLSTLRDTIAMTAAGIGQEFLPYIKQAALAIIEVSTGILKWVKEGDNLKNLLSVLGYTIVGLTSAFVAYNLVTKSAAIGMKIMEMATRGLNAAMKANIIGILAAVIMAVLVPAIIWLAKNWDYVKFKLVDFAETGKIKMYEFALILQNVVMKTHGRFIALMAKLPGVLGEPYRKINKFQQGLIDKTREIIAEAKRQQRINREAFYSSQKQARQEAKIAEEKQKAILKSNEEIMKSNSKRDTSMKAMLESIALSEQAANRQRIEEAAAFFEKRAEMEYEDAESRIEFLYSQFETINTLFAHDREARLNAEKALNKAIEKEEKKLFRSKVEFGGEMLGLTSSMLADIQTVFRNAGKESRKLAMTMKIVSAAEAAIASYLAFTRVLDAPHLTALYPANLIAAGITLAAGLAKQAAILSTPIPSGQTGLSDYTVPNIPQYRNDRAPVMASAGEHVSITPRGEGAERTTVVNIDVGENNLFRVIQRGIDSGKINVSRRNIGSGVFAT